nr:hypothetical protein [Tanacetum cinerariifolium]
MLAYMLSPSGLICFGGGSDGESGLDLLQDEGGNSDETSIYRLVTVVRVSWVIKFGDSYEVPVNAAPTDTTSDGTGKKKGRTVTVTADDMQKRKNVVKARTTLLLCLPDEHQLRFTKHSRGIEDVNTASVSTASTNVPTASANIGVVTISQDTACAYIASQSSGSQIKFEDINQIDKDDMEDMDIKWNMALISMRADRFWKKTWKKISIQGTGVAGFDKSKVECFNCHKMGHFARGLEFKTESSDDYIESLKKELKLIKKEKEGLDSKLTGFQTASKDLDSLLESQRLDKNKEGLGYSAVPPPHAQIYYSPKKDMSWTGFPEFKDDTTEASPSTISPKSFIKFVKANDSPTNSKTDKAETAKKPPVKYAEQYRKPTKKPNVRGNQRNWNNLKSHQLGPNFVMKKNACFNCGDFNHLAYDCSKRVKKETSRSQNTTHKSFTPRSAVHKPYRPPMRPMRSNMN